MRNVEMKKNENFRKLIGYFSKQEEDSMKQKRVIIELKREWFSFTENKTEQRKSFYEESFHRIKKATGISDINEVVGKWSQQEATRKNLQSLIEKNETTLDTISNVHLGMTQKLEQAKLSGFNCRAGNTRRLIDELEDKLLNSRTKNKVVGRKLSSVKKTLLEARSGIQHLMDRLEFIQEGSRQEFFNDDSITIVLKKCENSLATLLEQMDKQRGFVIGVESHVDCPEDFRQYNNRVLTDLDNIIKNSTSDDSYLGTSSEDTAYYSSPQKDTNKKPDQVLTRNNIKKASKIILGKHYDGERNSTTNR
uniref:ODAD1 central coiled coil region domain-containing protein n=1 Tax=Aplanochytrium stocchinoi TaxID=215587 RepID=A0A6S8ADK0_9STRA